MKRLGNGLAVLLAAAALLPAGAGADVVSDVRTDLTLSGFPGATVTVSTPPPASAPLDDASAANLEFEQLKPYLSADPMAPLPLLNITATVPTGRPLSGVLATPGLSPKTDIAVKTLALRLAAFEAVKHQLAAGVSLAGTQLTFDTTEFVPPVLIGRPSPADFPAQQTFGSLMSEATLRARIQGALPIWARDATIEITTDGAGERIVTLRLSLAQHAFQLDNVAALTGMLDTAQTTMVAEGANIGRTMVIVSDPLTQDPLYISGNDRLFTYRSAWYSPRVLAFARPSAPGGPATIDQATSTVTDAVPDTGG